MVLPGMAQSQVWRLSRFRPEAFTSLNLQPSWGLEMEVGFLKVENEPVSGDSSAHPAKMGFASTIPEEFMASPWTMQHH